MFLGEHIFKEWKELTGGAGVGRSAAEPVMFGYAFDQDSDFLTKEQNLYLLMLVLLLIFALFARNLARSKVGRAFAAVRDRDVAAEMMGINLTRTKVLAFAVSSFYAGCAGALLYTIIGFFDPGSFNLLLSVQFIAMVLIGGAGTVSGTIMGAMFISLLPTLTREMPNYIPFISATGDRHAERLPARRRSSTGCSSSRSCCSSREVCSASGSGSAPTGRAGRSATRHHPPKEKLS